MGNNYIQSISDLITISAFLETVVNKDHIEKTKAYAASRLKNKVDTCIVDLVSDKKFMEFVEEVKHSRTLAQSDDDIKRLIEEHHRDMGEHFVTIVPEQGLEKVQEIDQRLHDERVAEKVSKSEEHEVKEFKEKVKAGKMVEDKETPKKKSPGFKRVK